MKAPPPIKWLFLFHLNPNLEGVGWWFSLNFAALSNILLETFVANSVSITRRSLQILCKTQTQKTENSCRKTVTSLSFFGFLTNLEQSGGRIQDTESAKVVFSNSNLLSYKN